MKEAAVTTIKWVEDDVVAVCSCRTQPNEKPLVWTQHPPLLDPQQIAVFASCSVVVSRLTGNMTNFIVYYESPRLDEEHTLKLDVAGKKLTRASKGLSQTQTTLDKFIM